MQRVGRESGRSSGSRQTNEMSQKQASGRGQFRPIFRFQNRGLCFAATRAQALRLEKILPVFRRFSNGPAGIPGVLFNANGAQTGTFTASGSNGSVTQLTNGHLVIASQHADSVLNHIVNRAHFFRAWGALWRRTAIRRMRRKKRSLRRQLRDRAFASSLLRSLRSSGSRRTEKLHLRIADA